MPSRRAPGRAARRPPSPLRLAGVRAAAAAPPGAGRLPGGRCGLAAGPGAPGGARWAGESANRPRGISPSPPRVCGASDGGGRLPAPGRGRCGRDCGQGERRAEERSPARRGCSPPALPLQSAGVRPRCQPVAVSGATRTQLLQTRVQRPRPARSGC